MRELRYEFCFCFCLGLGSPRNNDDTLDSCLGEGLRNGESDPSSSGCDEDCFSFGIEGGLGGITAVIG